MRERDNDIHEVLEASLPLWEELEKKVDQASIPCPPIECPSHLNNNCKSVLPTPASHSEIDPSDELPTILLPPLSQSNDSANGSFDDDDDGDGEQSNLGFNKDVSPVELNALLA